MRRLPLLASGLLACCLAFEGSACREPAHAGAKPARPAIAGKAVAPLWVGPALSGSWYTAARNGEGFTLQVLDRGTALVVWFTYPPDGSPAQQAWILAQDGRIEGDRIRFEGAFTTRGPRFGAAFDPAALQILPWGTIEFRFLDCNRGEVSYSGPPGWGSGTREIVRLTALSELECGGKRRLNAAGSRAIDGLRSRSGSWFDPGHNGEGWQLEELPDGRNQVYWFTYDERGEQAWTIGVSATGGSRFEVASNLRPVGARFGSSFNPAAVSLVDWGRVRFDFSGCERGSVQWESTLPAFGSGVLAPVRLSRLAGTACHDGQPAVPAAGAWRNGPPMPSPQSEVATATFGSTTCVAGGYIAQRDVQCFDAAASRWTTLPPLPAGRDHAAAVAFEGELLVTGGNRDGLNSGDTVNGWRYRFAGGSWEPLPQLPDVTASSAAVLDGFAYFADRGGDLHQVNPVTLQSRVIGGDRVVARDHSQLVAFQGELWLIGGRNALGSTFATVSIFDPASETWRAGPGLGARRSGFAAAGSPTHLFVAGGERLGSPMTVIGSAEAIAAGEGAWTAIPSPPVAVHGVGGAVHGSAFHLYGGSGMAGMAVNTGDVQIYSFAP
ncbi:MAG: hypothetical protein NDI88_04240 [Lysobacter sp.]|nr:hypothetical protein [Lysobacter sp.]